MVAICCETSVSPRIPDVNLKNKMLQKTLSDLLTFEAQKIHRLITNLQNNAKAMPRSSAAPDAKEQMSLDRVARNPMSEPRMRNFQNTD